MRQAWDYTSIKLLAVALLGQVAVDAAAWGVDELDYRPAVARYVVTVAIGLARLLKGGPA